MIAVYAPSEDETQYTESETKDEFFDRFNDVIVGIGDTRK